MKKQGLFRQLIAIYFEQAKRNKALRVLAKQEWSLEFLTALVQRASAGNRNIEIEVINKSGNRMILRSNNSIKNNDGLADDIFNHLDDNVAVQQFIRDHTRR